MEFLRITFPFTKVIEVSSNILKSLSNSIIVHVGWLITGAKNPGAAQQILRPKGIYLNGAFLILLK